MPGRRSQLLRMILVRSASVRPCLTEPYESTKIERGSATPWGGGVSAGVRDFDRLTSSINTHNGVRELDENTLSEAGSDERLGLQEGEKAAVRSRPRRQRHG